MASSTEGSGAGDDPSNGDTGGARASPTAAEGKLCCGQVKWFDVSKGYGFITPDDQSGDVFVYQSCIQMGGFRSLDDQEVVQFVYKTSDKGRESTAVTGPGGADCKGSKRKGKGKRRKDDRCYNCNDHGHHAKNCPEPPLPKRCHHCKSEDHLVADCPDKPPPAPAPPAPATAPPAPATAQPAPPAPAPPPNSQGKPTTSAAKSNNGQSGDKGDEAGTSPPPTSS